MRNLWPRSPEIIRDRLGVNEDAKQLRSGLLAADFQFGLDIMHARELHSVWQGAVAGEIEAITDAADFYVVHVDDFREAGGDGFELLFQRGVSNLFLTRLNGRGFALNVGQDAIHFWNFHSNFRLELRDAIMSFLQLEVFIEFQVLFHMQLPFQILHANVMHVDVVPGGNGADAVENAFIQLRPGQRVDHDIGVREKLLHGRGDRAHDLLGALERDNPRQRHGKVGKVSVAGAADANAIDLDHAFDTRNGMNDSCADTQRCSVQQGVDGAPS